MTDTSKTTARTSARKRRIAGNGDSPAVRRAAEQKSRNRDIASRLRKSGRIVTLGGDIADMAEQAVMLALSADEGYDHIDGELGALERVAREETSLLAEAPHLLDESQNTIAELRLQHREGGRAVMRELQIHPGMFEEVQQAERATAQSREAVGGYRTALKDIEKLVKSLSALAEKFDIASLNAELEAGKSETHGVFLPLSEQARGLSEDWNAAVQRFATLAAEQKRIAGDADGKCGEMSDRIRALEAMVKGVRTSFDDLGAEREAILQIIDRMAGEVAACSEAFRNHLFCEESSQPDAESLQGGLRTLCDADNRFCDAIDNLAEHVELVSRAAADFSENTAPAAKLIDAAERLLAQLPDVSALAAPVSVELDAFEHAIASGNADSGKSGNGIDAVDSSCETAEKTVESLTGAYRSLEESMRASLDVMRQGVREFGNLHDEQRGIEGVHESMRNGIVMISRFEGRFAIAASRLESLAALSAMEVRNAGDRGGGFSTMPDRFAGIAAEMSETAAETGRIADVLLRQFADITKSVRNYGWRERMIYARSFAAALEEAVTVTNELIFDACSRIGTALGKCRSILRDTGTAASRDARLGAIADMIGSARDSVAARRDILDNMAEAAERLAEYADSAAAETG